MDDFLSLPDGLLIPLDEVRFETSRSSGPGGQNVNKVETRVTARFNVADSPHLAPQQIETIGHALSSRMTQKGELLVSSQEHRTQAANRRAALERLEGMLNSALTPVKPRRATRPSRASKARRMQEKRRQAQKKRGRSDPDW